MQSTSPETWKPIPAYEGIYEVSDKGRVRSLDRIDVAGHQRQGRVLAHYRNAKGYLSVVLHARGRSTRLVHHLVLESFKRQRQQDEETRHLNGDPSDNRLGNLDWGSAYDNYLDKVRHGTVATRTPRDACQLGHPLKDGNISRSKGQIRCLACNRARSYAYHMQVPLTRELADQYYATARRW